jgi:hypothetical protein
VIFEIFVLALASTVRPTSLAAVCALLSHDGRRRLMSAYLVAPGACHAGDESVVRELRQARVHRTGKGPILRAGPLTDDADQLVAVPGLLGDRVQESKWCVVVSAMSSASPRSLNCRPA